MKTEVKSGQLRRVLNYSLFGVCSPGDVYLVIGPDPDCSGAFCALVNGHWLSWHISSMEHDPVVGEVGNG